MDISLHGTPSFSKFPTLLITFKVVHSTHPSADQLNMCQFLHYTYSCKHPAWFEIHKKCNKRAAQDSDNKAADATDKSSNNCHTPNLDGCIYRELSYECFQCLAPLLKQADD
jgi:hypothetical protein